MAILYSIKGWDDNFENHETRKLKNLLWIPVPVKQDGDGYTELLEHENGAAHLGAWIAIVELAAKCKPRGQLIRRDNRPHTSRSIGRITRISPDVLGEAIPRLVQIGWLKEVTVNLPEGRQEVPEGRENPLDEGSEGKEGSELTNSSESVKSKRKKKSKPETDGAFEEWWKYYMENANGNEGTKAAALKAWNKRRKEGVAADEITTATKNYLDWEPFKNYSHQNASTFLGIQETWREHIRKKPPPDDPGFQGAAYQPYVPPKEE